MAPAEVEIFRLGKGSEYKKVHRGDAQEVETEQIKADVVCHSDSTEVEIRGQKLEFRIQRNGFPISTEGRFEEGRVRTYLSKEGDFIEVLEHETLSRIKVIHTEHDGSTTEG